GTDQAEAVVLDQLRGRCIGIGVAENVDLLEGASRRQHVQQGGIEAALRERQCQRIELDLAGSQTGRLTADVEGLVIGKGKAVQTEQPVAVQRHDIAVNQREADKVIEM